MRTHKKNHLALKIAKLPNAKPEREPQPWVGAVTLFAIVTAAAIAALCVQAALNATIDLEPPTLYDIFFVLGFFGMTAGGLVESNGHGPTYHRLHQPGQITCVLVNAVMYCGLLVVWMMYHGDERMEQKAIKKHRKYHDLE